MAQRQKQITNSKEPIWLGGRRSSDRAVKRPVSKLLKERWIIALSNKPTMTSIWGHAMMPSLVSHRRKKSHRVMSWWRIKGGLLVADLKLGLWSMWEILSWLQIYRKARWHWILNGGGSIRIKMMEFPNRLLKWIWKGRRKRRAIILIVLLGAVNVKRKLKGRKTKRKK